MNRDDSASRNDEQRKESLAKRLQASVIDGGTIKGRLLDNLRKSYEAGDPGGLLLAVRWIMIRLLEDERVDWAADAFVERLDRFLLWETLTLDEAFGIKRTKNRRTIAAKCREIARLGEAIGRIDAAHAAGRSLTDEFFAEIGEDLGIGKTELKGYWHQRHDLRSWAKSLDGSANTVAYLFADSARVAARAKYNESPVTPEIRATRTPRRK